MSRRFQFITPLVALLAIASAALLTFQPVHAAALPALPNGADAGPQAADAYLRRVPAAGERAPGPLPPSSR